MKATFDGVELNAVVGVVPENVSFFDDELSNFSHSPENSLKLKKLMGYGEHRIVKNGTTTSDLAVHGFQSLCDISEISAEDIDALIFVSQTPDFSIPSTSSYLHGKLGLSKRAYCIDINDGCCGFLRGVFEAASFIKSTGAKCILLICGDTLSSRVSVNDRNSYPLIGDAATLTLVRHTKEASPLVIELMHDGTGFDKLMIPAGGARLPFSEGSLIKMVDDEGNARSLMDLCMSGRDVFAFTQTVVPDFLRSFLDANQLKIEDIDGFYMHQANCFILDRIRQKFGIDQNKLPDAVVRKYGNSSSATIPLAIAERVSGFLETRGKRYPSILCGFGVGLSWGAMYTDLRSVIGRTEILNYGEC